MQYKNVKDSVVCAMKNTLDNRTAFILPATGGNTCYSYTVFETIKKIPLYSTFHDSYYSTAPFALFSNTHLLSGASNGKNLTFLFLNYFKQVLHMFSTRITKGLNAALPKFTQKSRKAPIHQHI